jgi:hypothetical protein
MPLSMHPTDHQMKLLHLKSYNLPSDLSYPSLYGAAYLVFQLNNTEASMEGITNISKTLSVNQDDEVMLELIFYRDHKY